MRRLRATDEEIPEPQRQSKPIAAHSLASAFEPDAQLDGRYVLSDDGRRRISEAVQRRWAKVKGTLCKSETVAQAPTSSTGLTLASA
jgi:hypothetical protein